MIEKTFNNYVTILRLFKLTLIQVKLDNLFKIKKSKTTDINYWISNLINS